MLRKTAGAGDANKDGGVSPPLSPSSVSAPMPPPPLPPRALTVSTPVLAQKKIRHLPDLAVRAKRTGIVIGAVLLSYIIGRFRFGFLTLVAMFLVLAWVWDKYAADMQEVGSGVTEEERKRVLERSLSMSGTPSENTYTVGTNSVKTVTAEDGTVQTQISESVQWLNIAIARAWKVAQPLVSRIAREGIEHAIATTLPPLLRSIKLDRFTLGVTPPRIVAIHSFPELVYCNDMQRQVLQVAVRLRWAPDDPVEFHFPKLPNGMGLDGSIIEEAVEAFEKFIDAEIGETSPAKPDAQPGKDMAPPPVQRSGTAASVVSTSSSSNTGTLKHASTDSSARLGSHSEIRLTVTAASPLPVSLTVAASKITLDATIFLRVYPTMPFGPPWVSRLQLRALEPPTTNLVLNPLGGSFDLFGVPYLSKWIHDGIDAGLGTLLCENGGIKIDFDEDGDAIVALGLERKAFEPAAGVLYLWIYEGKGMKNTDRLRLLGGRSDPYVRVVFGDKIVDSTPHQKNTLDPVWNHLTPLLIPNSIINSGPRNEDESVDGTITLQVYDRTDVTKPIGMGFASLEVADLCRSYTEEDRPKELVLPIKSLKSGTESNRGTLRVGYRYAPLGEPIPKGVLPADATASGAVLRVTIMSIDFPGAKFWQGHLRASLYDRECWRGISRQVWTKDLVIEEFEVYVSELSSAIFALRVHRGASLEVLREKPATKQPSGNEEDGSVAGEIVFNLGKGLANLPPNNWYALSGVAAKDLKSEAERVGITMKLSLRPIAGTKVHQDIQNLAETSLSRTVSAIAQQSLVQVKEDPPLGVFQFHVLESKELVSSGLNPSFVDPYVRFIKVWSPGNEFEVARTDVVPKTIEPVWSVKPGAAPWSICVSKYSRGRLALWNWNRLRPDQCYGIKDIEPPAGTTVEDLAAGNLSALFKTTMSCEPDPSRGPGWYDIWLPLVDEVIKGSGMFKMAKHKLRIAGHFVPSSKIAIEGGIPDPNSLVIVRIVVHQIQGVVNARTNLFVEATLVGRILVRSSIRVNARDALWNETCDSFVGNVDVKSKVLVTIKKAAGTGNSYEKATVISQAEITIGDLLDPEPARWFPLSVGSIRLSASYFPLSGAGLPSNVA